MLREKAKPVDDIDTAVLKALSEKNSSSLKTLSNRLPQSFIDFIDNLLQCEADNQHSWGRLAETLAASNLTASALAAFAEAIDNERDPRRRADSYERMSAIEKKLNMQWAADADQRTANRLRGAQNPQGLFLELDDGDLAVQTAHNDPEAYERLVASLPDSPLLQDPLRDPTLTKRVAQALPVEGRGTATDDCSFFIMDGDGCPIVQVEADVSGDRFLGCHESAITLTRLVESHPLLAQAEDLAVRQLELTLEWCGCLHAIFEWRPSDAMPPTLQAWIARSKAHGLPITAAWIDLSLDAEEIEKGYRTAHRQSLRWGRNNMRIVKTTTPDPVMLDLYLQIHHAARRVPGLSVDALAKYLDEERYNLYIAYFEDEPVVALLSSRHGRTTYYAASAKKIIGNKPLGHVVLHQAILDAKAEGQVRFDFGRLFTAECFGDKERSIALYKRGFASHTEDYLRYVVRA